MGPFNNSTKCVRHKMLQAVFMSYFGLGSPLPTFISVSHPTYFINSTKVFSNTWLDGASLLLGKRSWTNTYNLCCMATVSITSKRVFHPSLKFLVKSTRIWQRFFLVVSMTSWHQIVSRQLMLSWISFSGFGFRDFTKVSGSRWNGRVMEDATGTWLVGNEGWDDDNEDDGDGKGGGERWSMRLRMWERKESHGS